jgi:hypothetical protein
MPGNIPTTLGNDRYVGTEQITSLSTAKSLTLPDNARAAVLIPETQAVRIAFDGTTPTSADPLLFAGQDLTVTTREDLANVRLIEDAASATVKVLYFG